MAIDLFDSCPLWSNGGIKSLKISAKLSDGNPIDFPIDVIIENGDESTILGSFDETGCSGKTVTIGEQELVYVEPYPNNCVVTEEIVEDRRGEYYVQTIALPIPKVELYTNNQIKDFLFTDAGQYAIANCIAIFEDANEQQWIAGYTQPLVVQELVVNNNQDSSTYNFTFVATSYNRIRRFKNI